MSDVRGAVDAVMPGVVVDLEQLVAIPSVSSLPEHDGDVARCAAEVQRLLEELGCPSVRLLEAGGKPAVYGHFPAPEGAPTVLLYAHYDVQPTGERSAWTAEPFRATERDGRLFGRGTADDKGGLAVHLAALRAFEGRPPVGVKVFVEGEEEIGSPSMPALLDTFADELSADVFVIADSVNWEVGKPSLTTSLRGTVDAEVTVSTLATGLHSGQFGGVVPDALTALCRLLATLHDENGDVAVAGLLGSDDVSVEYPEDRLREETGVLDGVEWIGTGSLAARMWTKPAATVLAIDATPVRDASNTLSPTARAKVSLRLAPGDDADRAAVALARHLREHAEWGVRVDVVPGQAASGSEIAMTDERAAASVAAFDEAFGVTPVQIGCGGSIPIVAEFAARNPGALVLVTAVVDPTSRMHGIDESLDLGDLAKAAAAEALLLENLSQL
ncbi:dipeptidase [Tessaracoccus caeni]|uniref:dipeptidase n=1 Tax=Tessaracoccus caeni TaxID=3031239 RepID=UPI0023D9F3F0|nr:dipeptidase [Tessaracoccus caeni]MDF1487123.1 dipeptidase [Tessaracoccus caeni]